MSESGPINCLLKHKEVHSVKVVCHLCFKIQENNMLELHCSLISIRFSAVLKLGEKSVPVNLVGKNTVLNTE